MVSEEKVDKRAKGQEDKRTREQGTRVRWEKRTRDQAINGVDK